MPLYFGNGKQKITFMGSQFKAYMIMPKYDDVEPDIPTGIYDDTFPIEWNSLSVQGNVVWENTMSVKFSNLTPTASEMQNTTLTITMDGETMSGACESVTELGGQTVYRYLDYISISVVPEVFEHDDETVEAGMYVMNYGHPDVGAANMDFTLALAQPVTSAMYLYGTPAPSTVSYNGVELPDIEGVWTDKETYPYAYILATDMSNVVAGATLWSVAFTTEPLVAMTAVTASMISWALTDSQELIDVISQYNMNVGYNEWEFYVERTNDELDFVPECMIWTSHDYLNADGSVYLAATEPVQSGNIGLRVAGDMVKYGGVELPDIEAAAWMAEAKENGFTYLAMGEYVSDSEHGYWLFFNDVPMVVADGITAAMLGAPYDGNTGTDWSDNTLIAPLNDTIQADMLFWSNHDILNADGTTYLAASEPVHSGNIGLRVAGDKVKYGGVELPDIESVWTDKVTYPYACMRVVEPSTLGTEGEVYMLWLCTDVFQFDGTNFITAGVMNLYAGVSTQSDADTFGIELGVWTLTDENMTHGSIGTGAVHWTSADILNADGSVYLAATDPEPVQTVTYYNGAVLPELPVSELPIAVISPPAIWDTFYTLMLAQSVSYYTDDNGEWLFKLDGEAFRYTCDVGDTEWSSKSELPVDSLLRNRGGIGSPTWVNTDLLNEDGIVGRTGTDPIAVGDVVGYNHGLSEYPMLPAWDVAEYPYAVIGRTLAADPVFIVSKNPVTGQFVTGDMSILRNGEWGTFSRNGEWAVAGFYWANHDTHKDDIPESEPIPIYEILSSEPAAPTSALLSSDNYIM